MFCCQEGVWIRGISILIIVLNLQLASHVQAIPGLDLPQERTTGLGCIPEGRNISYQCTVTDTSNPPIGSTTWSGSAFQCPSTANQISLPHSQFNAAVTSTCGGLRATALGTNESNYLSELSLTAMTELNGTTISCSLSDTETISDMIIIGAVPPPPGPLTVAFPSESSLTVNWSPPSGPVEGGVGGYVFGVTGEGCGCVSMNVSSTSVTCSGWTAAGQTCSFEVRTLSQDCQFASSSMIKEQLFEANCDPAELGDNLTPTNSSQTVATANGVIVYNGLTAGSTAFLVCNDGYAPGSDSRNRVCMRDGSWSGSIQICVSTQMSQAQQNELAALVVLLLPALGISLFLVGLVAGSSCSVCRSLSDKEKLCCGLLTLGGLTIGIKINKKEYVVSNEPTDGLEEQTGPIPEMTAILDERPIKDSKNTTDGLEEQIGPFSEMTASLDERSIIPYNDFPYKLEFEAGALAPHKMSRPCDAVVRDDVAYFRKYRSKFILKYNALKRTWDKRIPECPVQDSALAILPVVDQDKIEYVLHTVGGVLIKDDTQKLIGDLYCLSERERADGYGTEPCWKKTKESMTVARKQVTTICDKEYKYLIAAGGRGVSGTLKIVEVMNISSKEWFTVASLPQPVVRTSACISRGFLYLAGGCTYDEDCNPKEVKYVFRISLPELIKNEEGTTFESIADLRYVRSVCIAFQDHVFAIGGTKPSTNTHEAQSTNLVYIYDPEGDNWKQLQASLTENRCFCFAASFTQPKPQLMVVGGYTVKHDEGCTNTVEIAELK